MDEPKYQMMERTWQTLLSRFGVACGVPLDTPSSNCSARRKILDAYIAKNNQHFSNKTESKQ